MFLKNSLQSVVLFLNQPVVKEGIKNVVSVASFSFGIIEVYDVYKIVRGREVSTEVNFDSPLWAQTAAKIVIVCAKISLILSGTASRPGVFMISKLLGAVFSTDQLESVFGPNTVFAVNPCHPRHVASIAAVMLALPSALQCVYLGICRGEQNQRQGVWLTDNKVRLMTLFNTITGRPVQHLGNRLFRSMMAI